MAAAVLLVISIIFSNAFPFSDSASSETNFLEGYYWLEHVDGREKIQNLTEEQAYFDSMHSVKKIDAVTEPSYNWYRVGDEHEGIKNGDYVRVEYRGDIQEVFPAIVTDVASVEVITKRSE